MDEGGSHRNGRNRPERSRERPPDDRATPGGIFDDDARTTPAPPSAKRAGEERRESKRRGRRTPPLRPQPLESAGELGRRTLPSGRGEAGSTCLSPSPLGAFGRVRSRPGEAARVRGEADEAGGQPPLVQGLERARGGRAAPTQIAVARDRTMLIPRERFDRTLLLEPGGRQRYLQWVESNLDGGSPGEGAPITRGCRTSQGTTGAARDRPSVGEGMFWRRRATPRTSLSARDSAGRAESPWGHRGDKPGRQLPPETAPTSQLATRGK